jgi:hypothetical protein
MKMVSMKGDDDDALSYDYSSPNFGYGLSICLNEDQCEALGITKMRAGTKVMLQASGIVTRTSESVSDEPDEKGNDLSLTVQITDLGLTAQGLAKNAAAILYGSTD